VVAAFHSGDSVGVETDAHLWISQEVTEGTERLDF
jgi:hypothetical protein